MGWLWKETVPIGLVALSLDCGLKNIHSSWRNWRYLLWKVETQKRRHHIWGLTWMLVRKGWKLLFGSYIIAFMSKSSQNIPRFSKWHDLLCYAAFLVLLRNVMPVQPTWAACLYCKQYRSPTNNTTGERASFDHWPWPKSVVVGPSERKEGQGICANYVSW